MGNISRKQFITLGAASAAVLGLAGCGGSSSSDSSSSSNTSSNSEDRSGNVYWLNFKPELDETAQKLAKSYMEKYPNVKVKVQTAASGTYEQTLTSDTEKTDSPTPFNIGTTFPAPTSRRPSPPRNTPTRIPMVVLSAPAFATRPTASL